MKKPRIVAIALLVVIALPLFSYSCTAREQTQSLDEQAQEIYRSLMCPLCPGQTIDQSQSELSAQMRSLVREKLEQGESREEILQFFVDRYGETVLAVPVKSGFNLIVWLTPGLVILAGGILLWVIIKRRLRSNNKLSAEMLSPASDDNADEKYLKEVEKELEAFNERGFR